MKKKFIITILLLALFISSSISVVNAKECTGINYAPPMPQVVGRMRTTAIGLKTSENQCKGSNTEVWFGKLEPWTEGSDLIYVYLYEEDPPGNDDELVKEYWLVYGSDGYIVDIIIKNNDLGNIDSYGDNICELYLSMFSSGYMGKTTPANKFTYQICMK